MGHTDSTDLPGNTSHSQNSGGPIDDPSARQNDDLALVARMKEGREKMVRELKKVIVGRMKWSRKYSLRYSAVDIA